MRPIRAALAWLFMLLLTAGCEELPTASSLHVAEARAQGERDVARVRREASEQYRQASANVEAARRRARQVAVEGEREIALTQAKADYDIGIKGCDALGGAAREACQLNVEIRYREAVEAARRIEYAEPE